MIGLHMLVTEAHLCCHLPEVCHKLPSCIILVKTQIVPCVGRDGQKSSHLSLGGCATRRYIHHLHRIYLILCHGIVGTLKPYYLACFLQRLSRQIGNPQSFTAVAPLCLALITAASIYLWSPSFLKAHGLIGCLWQYKRKGKVSKGESIRPMLGSQTEMPMKSILRIEVDAPELEIGIKMFLRFPVLRIELMDVVVIQVEWLDVLLRLSNLRGSVLDGLVEQSVADKVDESVRRHSHLVL